MRQSEFAAMLRRLADGWTGRDYETVAQHFAEDVFYSDPLNYTFHDRSSLLQFFRDDEGMPQSCRFHDLLFDEERQAGVAEYSYGGTYVYHGTVWIELKEGLIISWREYQHRSDQEREEFWNR